MTSSPRGTGPTRGRWAKADRSNGASNCVEVMIDSGIHHIRDSKAAGHGPVLALSASDWRRFCDVLLDPPGTPTDQPVPGLDVTLHADGALTIRRPGDGSTLRFTPPEVECFLDGLRCGEFGALLPRPATTA